MAWKGVITNAGDALLKKWPSGGVLELCRAAAGTGRVEEALLMAQTSLVNEKQEMGILSTIQTDDGPRLKLRLNVPEEGFALSQYGVWAKLDGGEAVLLAIYQNDADIPIPGASEEPDFEYVMYATICFTNLGELTVTIKPSTTVSKEDMDEYVENYVANALAGLDINEQTPSYEEAETLAPLSSGEKLSAAFGKIAKAVKELIAHIRDVTSNPHKVTYTQTGAAAENHGTHVTYSTAAPKGAGTASAGTAATVARSDHVHPPQANVTGSSGSCTGNAATATKAGQLTTARNIFGRAFNGTADIAGKATMYGHYTATVNSRYANSALEIRENDQVSTGQSDIGYAPSIGFHWSGRVAGTLAMGVDAIFRFLTQSGGRATVDANLNGNAATATNAANANKLGGDNSELTIGQAGNSAFLHARHTISGETADWYAPNGVPTVHIFGGTLADTSYQIPSTTGKNASGTWGINITGNAKTATTATSAGSCTGNAATATNATNHINNKNNPHGVTLTQLGAAAASHTHDVSQVTGAAKMDRGSYTGTGTYGRNNCNVIATNIKTKFIFIFTNCTEHETNYTDLAILFAPILFLSPDDAIAKGLESHVGLCYDSNLSAHKMFGAFFNTGGDKYSVKWFADSAKKQMNVKGYSYNWVAIGA